MRINGIANKELARQIFIGLQIKIGMRVISHKHRLTGTIEEYNEIMQRWIAITDNKTERFIVDLSDIEIIGET